MLFKRRTNIILLLFIFFPSAYAQRHTLNGYVSDRNSGERLIGATIVDSISGYGTVTNNSGFYTLTLTNTTACLHVSYVGYTNERISIPDLNIDTLINIRLKEQNELQEVTVVGRQSISGPHSVQMSTIEIPVQQIKGIPALMGEVDVMKAIQLLPGVQSGSEGSGGMYVRGGGPDENLILLDGVPLYNVSHMMGFFSVFNADAVKNVTLYKGDFPAHFGSRLSGIVDVRQNDGNMQRVHGSVSVGTVAAKLSIEGPILWSKKQVQQHKDGTLEQNVTTFNISARRTYFDLFTTPIMRILTRKEMDDGSAGAGYYFYDVNAKITHRFSDNDKLSGSFYTGDDVVYATIYQKETTDFPIQMNMRWNWGNILGSLEWEHRFNARIFSTTRLSYTRYRYDLKQGLDMENKEADYSVQESLNYHSRIGDLTFQTNFDYNPSPKHNLRWGAEYIWHQFRPEVGAFQFENSAWTDFRLDTTLTDGILQAHEAAIYVEENYTPVQWFKLNVGVRGSLYSIDGITYPSAEPRISLRAMLYKDLAFKASYAYMSQYVHLLSSSNVSLPTDLWVPVTKNLPPMRSMQVAAGLSYNLLEQVELSVEGYYKKMLNLLEYKDGATFMGSSEGWQEKVCVGDGWSYGVEFLAQRKIGKLTGWVGYTWSRSMRQFNKPGQEINFGKPFHAKYDREHDLSLTLMYQITPRIDISGTFIYGTGTRATLGTQIYYDPIQDKYVTHIEERNNYKMPDYHRLDIGANFHFPHRKWKDAEHLLSVSIYNVYNNMNPFLLYPDGNRMVKITLFPILPSISYSFKF